jgi:hypothetical protein
MSKLVIGTNSWTTVAEANTYMETRFGSWEFWTDETNKEAALITAYNKIVNSGFFADLPDTANVGMKAAQCEMALFLCMEGGDINRRAGLQAQGVVQAGIAKETYDPNARGKLAFPPEVLALLKDYSQEDNGAFGDDLTRDDTEDVA